MESFGPSMPTYVEGPEEYAASIASARIRVWRELNNPDEILNLSSIGLESIPRNIPENVKYLHLSNNRISAIFPEDLRHCTQLEELTINHNHIQGLCESFLCLPSLYKLSITDNNIRWIHSNAFKDLTFLTELNISTNRITNISDEIFRPLINLTALGLSFNPISVIHNLAFKYLTKLEILLMASNTLTIIPNKLFDGLTNLSELSLYSNNISYMPRGVFDDLINLEYLTLSQNRIQHLDSDIFKNNINLQMIFLSHNLIEYLSKDTFSHLTKLITLHAYYNPLLYKQHQDQDFKEFLLILSDIQERHEREESRLRTIVRNDAISEELAMVAMRPERIEKWLAAGIIDSDNW